MPRRKLTIDDVLRLQRPSQPRASPRGSVAFVVERSDTEKNTNVTEIHVIHPDGTRSFLTGRSDTAPRWSPDGSLLAFLSRRGLRDDKDRGVELYVWPGTGEPRRIAVYRHGASLIEWLDQRHLAVVVGKPKAGMHDEDGDYVATDRLPLWFDGEGLVAGMQQAILLVDVESGYSRELAVEDTVDTLCACNGRLYYTTPVDWRRPTYKKIVELDPSTREARVVAEGYAVAGLGCIGGSLYALMHQHEIGIASHYKLWLIDSDGKPSCLTCGRLDRNIRILAGDLDGNPVIAYADSGSVILAVVDEDGGVRDITSHGMYVEDAHAALDTVVYVASKPTMPPEVYRYTRGGGHERVTSLNQWLVEEVELYEPRHLRVVSEGEEIDGWLIVPPGEGPKPLILYIHGGPKGMYGYYFHPEMQLMAAEGFIVAYSNPHGSDGYSEEFADIRGKYGEIDYQQLMDFLDHAIKTLGDEVDVERLAVTGISYGGYMTNVIVTKTDRFRAAVSENGIADWVADYWASDIGYWFNPDQIGGTPLDNLEEYIRKSPVYSADRVKTPMLIIHSMNDYRCFIDQSLAMHTALVVKGKESRLVVFTKGSHAHSIRAEPRHRRKRYQIKIEWLKEKLGLKAK